MSTIEGIVGGFRERSGELTFLDRLDDLRGRLIGSAVVLAVTTGLGFFVAARPIQFYLPRRALNFGSLGTLRFGGWDVDLDVLGFFTAPIEPYLAGARLKYLSPTDPFFITLKLAIAIGFVLALPYLLYQLWGLVAPLMRREERRLAGPALVAAVLLFTVGAVFCYLMVIPLMLRFTLGFQTASLEQYIVIGDYLAIILRMLLAFGLAFELPIVVLLGTVLGILTPEFLVSKRRHAIAILTIVSAFVTPPDLSSLILLMLPVWLLYELSIVMSRAIVARRRVDELAPRG